jgi:hypothetical protein
MPTPSVVFRVCWFLAVAVTAGAGVPEPREFAAEANPNLETTDGEQFCWHASAAGESFLRGYEATGDVRWLEGAREYYDFLLGRLTRDPDGREGWIGHSIWEKTSRTDLSGYRTDALVGDAILLAPMVRFAEFVNQDSALAARFAAPAARYVEKAAQIGWEKWNARGTYYRDAAGLGSYRMPAKFIDADTGQWVAAPPVAHSENLNKHSAMAIVMVRLWRVTGREEYRTRAVEVFARLKQLFRYFPGDDRVSWNFWMPHGPHDITGEKLASWVAVHPNRPGYQAEEVARMVEMYDSGLVFDRADLQRLINTNHYMKVAGGNWRSSDGSTDAGRLWPSLARFDAGIREQWAADLKAATRPRERLDLIYLEEVIAKNTGWARRLLREDEPVAVHEHAPQPGRVLSATVVIPNELGVDDATPVRLVTQTRGAGELKIELVAADGRGVFGELYRGPADPKGGVIMPAWDGTNPKTGRREPGAFAVRWSLQDDVRTERVWVKAASSVAPLASRAVVITARTYQGKHEPGNVIDGDLETRWSAEGNEQWLCFDLGEVTAVAAVELAFAQGDRRNALFAIECSVDGIAWQSVFDGQSGGKSTASERFGITPTRARYVRYMGFGNSDNDWNSVTEMRIIDGNGKPIP